MDEPVGQDALQPANPSLSRRGFLRSAAIAGGGLIATGIAACSPGATASWTFGPTASEAASLAASATAVPTTAPSAAPLPSASVTTAPSESIPPGWAGHDVETKKVVDRFLAGEWKLIPGYGNQLLHPWHLHGMHFQVVARDGWPLGSAAFRCDILGVNPGERYDVVVDCDNPGASAFHCHILPHAEGMTGMYGMVTALIVQP